MGWVIFSILHLKIVFQCRKNYREKYEFSHPEMMSIILIGKNMNVCKNKYVNKLSPILSSKISKGKLCIKFTFVFG